MAFSDLCHIGNAYKSVENEPDQSDRIMEENAMVRDLITKILDETGPNERGSSLQTPEKGPLTQTQYQKPEGSFPPPFGYPNNAYNYPNPTDQPGFNYNPQNGFTNNFAYNDSTLLGVDPVDTAEVTPEQLNLLRLAAQEIGGAQFASPKANFDNLHFFDQSAQRNPMQENAMFPNNFNRPNSLNLDMGFNTFDPYMQRYQNGMRENPENSEMLMYLNQMPNRDDQPMPSNMEFKMPENTFQNDEFKMQDPKMYFNRNLQPPYKNFNKENFFVNDMAQMVEHPPPNFDFNNAPMNFKPNGFQQNEFMQRRDIPPNRDGFQGQPNGAMNDQRNFENGQNMQQAALMRQNQELARQMSLLMRSRPPPNQLNVDVTFLHENPQFNLGLGALLGPSTSVPPPVLPSPMLDMPLLAPFYTMRNMRGAATSSGILHARLDACYEQWRQLERERKRTEARLALAYPGRAVSSSNSIPVPRLPPCPTRVDRLTVDMLREHTKVLTLMGKMETLRASVCAGQHRRPKDPKDLPKDPKDQKEDPKITVLKRGQDNVEKTDKEAVFDPASWKEDVGHLAEIAPHSEVESAMLAWRSAVGLVQLARRRELQNTPRFPPTDPILQLAEAVKQLAVCARRARCAMWCDLTLTVALAPPPNASANPAATVTTSVGAKAPVNECSQPSPAQAPAKPIQATPTQGALKQSADAKSKDKEKPPTEAKPETKPGTENNNNNSKTTTKNEKPDNKRRQQNYRKVNGRGDFYQHNQRYDSRFMQNRHPYYLATGPIN